MKILTVGDIHGRDDWKSIDPSQYDKIIFVGDYVDSYEKTNTQIMKNLIELIDFKIQNQEKVILLLGNHDYSYFGGRNFRCSGFRFDMFTELEHTFKKYYDLFDIVYQHKNWIWSHAGITKYWLNHLPPEIKHHPIEGFGNTLNQFLHTHPEYLSLVGVRRGGRYQTGSLIWADTEELIVDYLEGVNQIVGHNRKAEVKEFITKTSEIIVFTDVQDYQKGVFYEKEFA